MPDQAEAQFSENFARSEFELEGAMPDDCVPAFTFLCLNILEPIRRQFYEPMEITSGFRTEEGNAAAHGNDHSEHMATKDYAAADFEIPRFRADMRGVFDWIRLNSGLPFHIVTLEHGQNGDVIHISCNSQNPLRIAKEGATHNSTGYIEWAVG